MSEPEAKKYVLDSIEQCREALAALESAGDAVSGQKKKIEEAVETLEALKEKVFLKTKKAEKPAYLTLEASQAVAERVEDLDESDEDTITDLNDAVNQLKDNVTALQGASKQHSVIVT